MLSEKELMKMAIVAVVGLALGMCTGASDGRIPIGTVPYTISNPGSYYLTADLLFAGASPCITILANHVSLDLNGHYVWNEVPSSGASCIYASGYYNLAIFNGTLGGGYVALDVVSVPSGTITADHLNVTACANSGITIWGSSSSPYAKVQVTNSAVTLSSSASGGGIYIAYVQGGRIASNVIWGGGAGASVGGQGIAVALANGVIVEDNTASNATVGIYIWAQGCKVLRNTCAGNYYGIECVNSNYLDVSENNASVNAYGLYFSSPTGCVYRNNMAQGNTSANYTVPTGTTNGGGNF